MKIYDSENKLVTWAERCGDTEYIAIENSAREIYKELTGDQSEDSPIEEQEEDIDSIDLFRFYSLLKSGKFSLEVHSEEPLDQDIISLLGKLPNTVIKE